MATEKYRTTNRRLIPQARCTEPLGSDAQELKTFESIRFSADMDFGTGPAADKSSSSCGLVTNEGLSLILVLIMGVVMMMMCVLVVYYAVWYRVFCENRGACCRLLDRFQTWLCSSSSPTASLTFCIWTDWMFVFFLKGYTEIKKRARKCWLRKPIAFLDVFVWRRLGCRNGREALGIISVSFSPEGNNKNLDSRNAHFAVNMAKLFVVVLSARDS